MSQTKQGQQQHETTTSARVLLAEDEEHTRLTLSLILRKIGFLVTTVADGREALKSISDLIDRQEPPALLVIDIQMPGLTGLDLMAELDKRGVFLPTVVISGYQYRKVVEGCQAHTRVAYLEKPFSPEEFLACLDSVVEKRPRKSLRVEGGKR
ncbi:response regulator [Myxococcota bacterium]